MSAPAPAAADIPEGFQARRFGEGFIAVNGPLYARRPAQGGFQLGFRVEQRHCNPMGICHGGMMATFCDMLLPLSAHVLSDVGKRFLPTINLQIDYLAASPLGAWVQGEAQVLRTTKSLVFMQGLVHADGTPVARVSGIFKIGPPFDDTLERKPFREPEP
jgi:uncharacterized protein (TIGR00369 family)